MIKIPPYLKKSDTIGMVCPAGYMAMEKVKVCIKTLKEWGYQVRVGKTVGSYSDNYFSGTDEERLKDFQQMLDDDSIRAILCARGGYGLGRIIDKMSFKKFNKNPKWIIGFSDVTVLHSHLYSNFYIASLHAPMAGAFNGKGSKNEYVLSLKNALQGKISKYQCKANSFNRKGEAVGELIGGNLSLLTHLIGSGAELSTNNKILFIEDVGEYTYQADRMMWQLKRSGKLEKLAGLIVGGFTDMKDTERPFGKTIYEIIHEVLNEYDYPVCFGFPVSHGKENYALKHGVEHKLKVGKSKVMLEELPLTV
jgi:muramoyltetrapeptide carboxypeptidase